MPDEYIDAPGEGTNFADVEVTSSSDEDGDGVSSSDVKMSEQEPQQVPKFILEAVDDDGNVLLKNGDQMRIEFQVTPNIKWETSSNTGDGHGVTELKTNCGKTETIKRGNAIGNLTVQHDWGTHREMAELRYIYQTQATPRVICDLYEGRMEITDITMQQRVEASSANIEGVDGFDRPSPFPDGVRVYRYQIQLKSPGNTSSAGGE